MFAWGRHLVGYLTLETRSFPLRNRRTGLVKRAIQRVAGLTGHILSRREGPFPIPFEYGRAKHFLYFKRMFELIADVPGDVVECGVYRGTTLLMLCYHAREEGSKRQIWGFDSFEGFAQPSAEDQSILPKRAGDLNAGVEPGWVFELLLRSGLDREWVLSNVTLVKGFFDETLDKYRGDGIALLHLDVDLYAAHKSVLTQLYDRVVPGGVILFDEYLSGLEQVNWPGAQIAIDEFLGDRGDLVPTRDQDSGKYFLRKPL